MFDTDTLPIDRPTAPRTTSVVHIAANGASLVAELTVPAEPAGLALVAKTNASRHAARDMARLAVALHRRGYATLVFDLLTPDEEMVERSTHGLHGDLALLARRLIDVVDWVGVHAVIDELPIGIIGEGAGAPAAFVAACVRPDRVAAVVSHGERPDLATPVLGRVLAPALLVVSDGDPAVARANDIAFQRLRGVKEIVRFGADRSRPHAAVEELSRLVLDWFSRHVECAHPDLGSAETLC